jgi:hypothetical protein
MKKGIFTLLILSIMGTSLFAQTFTCVNWVNMANEPDYAAEPYDKPTQSAWPTPAGWTFNAEALDFDAAWAVAGEEAFISKATNTAGGDPYDLGAGDTYGASWKAMYDETNIYVFIKWIGVDLGTEGFTNMEVMFQPTSIDRYEPDFTAAAGDKVLQNHSYARYIELGGGKAVFKDGLVTEVAASKGTTAQWSANEHALTELALTDHYWVKDNNVVKAVMVLPLNGLSYPEAPFEDLTVRTPLEIVPNETKISWEMKANLRVGDGTNDDKIEYCWSSNANNVYAVNYYAGYLLFAQDNTSVNYISRDDVLVYYANQNLHIRGVEPTDVRIYNLAGMLIGSHKNVSSSINLEYLNNGIYIVQLNNSPRAYKIVKF